MRAIYAVALVILSAQSLSAQAPTQYSARTDREVQPETPLSPPPVNKVFRDPDFGSRMVRVTDENTAPFHPGSHASTADQGETNTWSRDTQKLWVHTEGSWVIPFSFDPLKMQVARLTNPKTGGNLILPLGGNPFFSYVDPDLIYGTRFSDSLTLWSYRFSTGALSPVVDMRTCGVQAPFTAQARSADDLTVSASDKRFAAARGGPRVDSNMYVIVYDKTLGCRWYNTQTGEIGGQWGPSGRIANPDRYLIHHPILSKSGEFVRISGTSNGTAKGKAFLEIWQVGTLNVTPCSVTSAPFCGGYLAGGYSHFTNHLWIRPYDDITHYRVLVQPPKGPVPMTTRYSWNNADPADRTPVCAINYPYDAEYSEIEEPWQSEVICIETDGLDSKVWRFAHNRSSVEPTIYRTMPLINISRNGRFAEFSSDWHEQLGTDDKGLPRSDVFVVELK